MGNKILFLFLAVVLSISVGAMEVSNVKGSIDVKGDVSHDFGKAILKVSPETSYSLNREHLQTLTITNRETQDLYFFVDPYFKNALANIQIQRIDYTQKNTEARTVCNNVTGTVKCEELPSQTYFEPKTSKISSITTTWGGEKHYVATSGVLIKAGSTQDFLINYKTTDGKGKWNARIWANTVNDYSCILDYNNNCLFDYVIDPSYSEMANLTGISSYYKFDEGTGNTAYDSNTTSANDLTKGASATWVTDGIIINASNYTSSATSYFRDTVATALPNKQGWISVWMNHTANASANAHYVWEISDASANNRLILYFANPNNDLTLISVVGGSGVSNLVCPSASHNIQINKWYMVTAFWNTTSDLYYIYVNGTNVTGCTKTNAGDLPAQTEIATGNSGVSPASGNAFQGKLDEMGIWNRGIPTATELSNLYNNATGCSFPFDCWSTDTSNFTIATNLTFNTTAVETSYQAYYVNFSYHNLNVSNVSNVTFNIEYLPSGVTATQVSNGSSGNTSWQYYSVTAQRPTLNPTPTNTNRALNFTYNANYVNGTVNYTSTANQTQTITTTYTPINIYIETPIIETFNTTWNCSYNISGGNTDNVTLTYLTTWNNTNRTGTLYASNSDQLNATFDYIAEMLNSTDNSKQFTMTPYLNITFNGTTVTRNGSAGATILSATQLVYKMVLTNCSGNTSISNITTEQFYIRDLITDALMTSASSIFQYGVWLPARYSNTSYARYYNFSFTNNATPQICIYPNLAIANYSVDRYYLVTSAGYIDSTSTAGNLSRTNVSVNTTIYITNVTGTEDVVFNVIDEVSNAVENATITIELFNTTYILISSGQTDFQGQKQFTLNLDYIYRVNISMPNGTLYTLTTGQPASVTFQILTNSLTFSVLLGAGSSLIPLSDALGLNHTLTYSNTTNIINLTFNDPTNVSSQICLKVNKINITTITTLINNCTSNKSGSLTYNLGTQNGTFEAFAIMTSAVDSNDYVFDTLSISRPGVTILGIEGYFWAIVVIMTTAMLGFVVTRSAMGSVVGCMLGIALSHVAGLLTTGFSVYMGLAAIGALIIYGITKWEY